MRQTEGRAMIERALSIAILTHSTNPRGGVVHSLELGDALTRLGHDVVVHAPDRAGTGFFRATSCKTVGIPASAVATGVTAMVEARISDYLSYFDRASSQRFDVWHAQDGISGNALATLRERGRIAGFVRTVHHIDSFQDQRLAVLQKRAITAANELFVVSRVWQQTLRRDFDRQATIVGNAVDTRRFAPEAHAIDGRLRAKLKLSGGPVFLAVGGIEARKNTIAILAAFGSLQRRWPHARLVIAGGASILDHSSYRRLFDEALARSTLPAESVVYAGPLPQDEMPALYRLADALVFASKTEGFGLVVLEAMASGTPVVVSRVAPFTEYLGDDDVGWCDPSNPPSIAAAMQAVLDPALRQRFAASGHAIAARHDWKTVALAHLPAYTRVLEACDA
jgi:glycosyltransferase-like protein